MDRWLGRTLHWAKHALSKSKSRFITFPWHNAAPISEKHMITYVNETQLHRTLTGNNFLRVHLFMTDGMIRFPRNYSTAKLSTCWAGAKQNVFKKTEDNEQKYIPWNMLMYFRLHLVKLSVISRLMWIRIPFLSLKVTSTSLSSHVCGCILNQRYETAIP